MFSRALQQKVFLCVFVSLWFTNHRDTETQRFGRSLYKCCSLAILLFAVAAVTNAQTPASQASMISGVGFEQRLDEQVPLDVTLRDEQGTDVTLANYFNGKPVILALVYYNCPMLCTMVLNGLTETLIEEKFNVGEQFEVVTLSIDRHETAALAQQKKSMYLTRYGRSGASAGWHFLTGDEQNIARVAAAVGFHYRFDPTTGQFAHPSGILVLTPQGKIARYFYGIEYSALD